MGRRTQTEIEMDCKKIKEAATIATTFKEIEELTGLSYPMIKTTLSKHPIIFKRIKKQLDDNKEKAEQEKRLEEEKQEISQEVNDEVVDSDTKKLSGYVIDASITGIEDLKEILSKICCTKSKIILTSVTIKELGEMQKFKDVDGNDARYILSLAVEKPENFETVLIDETLENPDACIVQYCASNKEEVTLLTSDKEMALNARMYSVPVQYFKQTPKKTDNKAVVSNKSKIKTLIPANKIGEQLFISNFQRPMQSIRLISDEIEYNDGVRELKVGDDVLIATNKIDCITFAHYRIISLQEENNCELIYSRRFYDYSDLRLSECMYKSFMKDFKHKHNL